MYGAAYFVALLFTFAWALPDCQNWHYDTPEDWHFAYCGKGINNLCQKGEYQSPVIIKNATLVGEPDLTQISFNTDSFIGGSYRLVNRGHHLDFVYRPADAWMNFSGTLYTIGGYELHVPAEHIVALGDTKQERADAEIQFKFYAKDGTRAFVSVLLDATDEITPLVDVIQPFIDGIPQVLEPGQQFALPFPGLSDLLVTLQTWGEDGYYYYPGSRTIPPCGELIHWIVYETRGTMGRQQIVDFKRSLGTNARPLQREVFDAFWWNPFQSRGEAEPDFSLCYDDPDKQTDGILSTGDADECVSRHGGGSCAFCAFFKEGEEVGTCFQRNGASCEDIWASQTASSFCPIAVVCPASTFSTFPVVLMLSLCLLSKFLF